MKKKEEVRQSISLKSDHIYSNRDRTKVMVVGGGSGGN